MTTATNPPFYDWWPALNQVLLEQGENEALYGDARFLFTQGIDPSTAAIKLVEKRKAGAPVAGLHGDA